MTGINPNADDGALLSAAESRIDVALAKLILTAKSVKEAAQVQEDAAKELREARDAIRALRDRIRDAG